MILASEHETNGKPTVLALGVQRAEGHTFLAWAYVEPTPGVDEEHAPLPAGPLRVRAITETKSEAYAVEWPGLTTGPALKSRAHTRVILPEVNNEQ